MLTDTTYTQDQLSEIFNLTKWAPKKSKFIRKPRAESLSDQHI